MADKKDWANISDDEDESSEESPEPVSTNQPIEHVQPQEQQEQQQVETQHEEKQEHQRRHHDQRPRRSEDEKKTEILRELEALTGPKVYLNLHGLNPNVKADVIREFYQGITISSVIASQTKEGLFDLEFANKEDAVKAVEKGTGELGKSKFCLRMSNRNYPKDSSRPYEKKDRGDRGNKGYGQKGQGNRGGYDNRNRDDYYYNKNQEGGQRGGYDKKNRDQGSWKQGGGDRDQGSWKQGGGPRNEPQYQVRTNEERKTEEQQFSHAKRQDSDKWEKGLQLPDEPRKQEFKKRDDYQRRDDNQGNYRDKFQMKKYNSDYTEGGHGYSNRGQDYRNNEEKSDTIEKGRGAKKYNQDEPLEQDKILQMKDKQSSYKSQGGDKGYHHKKDYNKGYDKGYGGGYGGGDNYNKSRYYDDQKNYKGQGRPKDNEYYQGKGDDRLQIEKKSSQTNRDESYKVYTKKSDNAGQGGQTPSGSTSTPELLKKSSSTSQGSKNTANPFSILENENGKK